MYVCMYGLLFWLKSLGLVEGLLGRRTDSMASDFAKPRAACVMIISMTDSFWHSVAGTAECSTPCTVKNLTEGLFTNYDNELSEQMSRNENQFDHLKVYMGLAIHQMLDFDHHDNTATFAVWWRMWWRDTRLNFDGPKLFPKVRKDDNGQYVGWKSQSDFLPIKSLHCVV